MGRRRDPAKISLERFNYQNAYQRIFDETSDDLILVSAGNFKGLTEPLRIAARKANLKLLKGKILQKNNHTVCRILLFPWDIQILETDIPGKSMFFLEDFVVVRATCDKESNCYQLKRLKLKEKRIVSAANIYEKFQSLAKKEKDFRISEVDFNKLMLRYVEELRAIGLVDVPDIIAATIPQVITAGKGKEKTSVLDNFSSTGYYDALFPCNFEKEEIRPRSGQTIESLFFAATLFSLCKPLFSFGKLKHVDSNFALEIQPEDSRFPEDARHLWTPDGKVSGDDAEELYRSLCTLNDYVKLYCDYRMTTYGKNVLSQETLAKCRRLEAGEFRNNWNRPDAPAYWMHLGFPLVYSDYYYKVKGNEEFDGDNLSRLIVSGCYYIVEKPGKFKFYEDGSSPLKKKNLEELCEANCLPIILSSMRIERCKRPEKNCLTITWPLSEMKDIRRKEKQHAVQVENAFFYMHEEIKSIYYYFLKLLSRDDGICKVKMLKRAYRRALKEISIHPDRPTKDEEHKACLLGALYFADDLFARSESAERVAEYFSSHVEYVRSLLGQTETLEQVATGKDFAVFVREMLKQKDSIVFYWDEDGIYLHYKEYWDRFMNYCEKQSVSLPYSAGMFRRQVLAPQGYIRPQYHSNRPGAQIRYDYRKKNQEGEEAVVLNVSLDILRLAYPKTRNSVSGIALLYRSLGEN